jgi:hypothetical protein
VGEGYTTFLSELQPRVLNGSVWIFTAIAGLVLYYRLPIGRFQKGILLSYVPYVLIFTVFVSQSSSPLVNYANQLAYVALIVYWNVVIWRRDVDVDRPPIRPPAASGPDPGPA